MDANTPVITVAMSGVPVGGKMWERKLKRRPSELMAYIIRGIGNNEPKREAVKAQNEPILIMYFV